MKKHIRIENGYNIWTPTKMQVKLEGFKLTKSIIIEWWIHNICYYVTKPFIFIPQIKKLNLRAKDVDLDIEIEKV